MRYLSSDNVNDQKRDEVGTKASPAGKLLSSWSLGTDSLVAAGCPWLPEKLIIADKCIKRQHLGFDLFPTEVGGKIPMSYFYSSPNPCRETEMCSQQWWCWVRMCFGTMDLPSTACRANPQYPGPKTVAPASTPCLRHSHSMDICIDKTISQKYS